MRLSMFFVFGKFSQPNDKKKKIVNPTKGFLRFNFFCHILTKKPQKLPYLNNVLL
jgi:hypothetical protein